MNKSRVFIVLLMLIVSPAYLPAQDLKRHFKHITKDQGLSSNKVTAIMQDNTGFMWFGTEEGLTRYDGNNFEIFRHEPDDSLSLSDNYINCIYEDPVTGDMWIGTRKGLNHFNKTNYKFCQKPDLFKADTTFHGQNILSVLIDDNRNTWVGTTRGLYAHFKKTEKDIVYRTDAKHTISNNSVNCMFQDSRKNIWAGTSSGLNCFDSKTNTFKKFNLLSYDSAYILSIYEDSRRNLWIATNNRGVFELRNGEIKHYWKGNYYLKNNKVHGVTEDDQGNMYLAVRDGGGLHYLDYSTGSVRVLSPDTFDPNSISSSVLLSIFKDRFGNIWIGTWSRGVDFIDKNRKQFSHYKVNFKIDGLINNNVRSAFQDSNGDIWIGTKDEGCLSKFDPVSEKFTHYQRNSNDPHSLSNPLVLSIGEARPGFLLIGTYSGGMELFDKRTGKFYHHKNEPGNARSLSGNYVAAILKDRHDTIWVATLRDLQKFDLRTRTFTTVNDVHHVKCLIDYDEDKLYIGANAGLFLYNRKDQTITKCVQQKNDPAPITVSNITGMTKDQRENLWITTSGNGLIRFNAQTGQFKAYKTDDGLPSDITCAVQTDERGHIWVSTTNGLSKFNPASETFRNYFVSEGLQGNEFEKSVGLKTRDGHILFGGSNGFNYFYPDSIKDNAIIPKVVLTDFKVFNKPVPINVNSVLQKHISLTETLGLDYRQSVITFEFAALNFSSAENNQYAYILDPLEKEWNYIGKRNVATYSSLPAGDYTFKVKAANNDGFWNEAHTSIQIKVLPPPWKSWWAYLAYAALIAFLIYLFARYKTFKTQLQIARIEQEKQQELNQIKLQFFTNISHEFKTPLTLILSPLKKLMKLTEHDQQIKRHLDYVERNTIRLQNLINQLMDFRSIENKKLAPLYEMGNIVDFIRELLGVFQPVAEEHQIGIAFHSEPDQINAYFDPDKTEKIFYNLLSNAVKFTPPLGTVTVSVNILHQFNDKHIHPKKETVIKVQITNSGSPIAEEELPHIFESYYHIEKPGSIYLPGTGIGLAFTKELVGLLGGSIVAKSDDHVTSFTVLLPFIEHYTAVSELETIVDKSGEKFQYTKQLVEVLKAEKLTADPKVVNDKAPPILIVEDDKELAEFLFDSFSKDYKVTMAADGLEGLSLALKASPLLIISDVMMPKTDGIELCRKIKTNIATSHIPVILLTASGSNSQKMKGMETGADVYIQKPFDLEFLKLQVKNIIQTRKAIREAFAKKINPEPANLTITSADEQFVKKAISVVEENMTNTEFDIDAFVKAMNMSRTLVYQKIRALTDLSINEFIINIRLKRAIQLLKHSSLTVSEIAFQVGFNSPNYFGVCFKKNFKQSPAAFAEHHRVQNANDVEQSQQP